MVGIGQGFTILIVDDDPDVRDMVATILSSEDYAVVMACNGREALALLASDPLPAAIILDVSMPVMNGWQFLVEQRKNDRIANIPVVLMSGDTRIKEIASACSTAGHLSKPVVARVLLTLLGRLLANRPSHGSA